MIIDLRPLLSGERSILDIDYRFTPKTDEDGTLPLNLAGVKLIDSARAHGVITNNAGYMRIVLKLAVEYESECARCLKPLHGVFETDYERTVAVQESLQNADADEDAYDEYVIARNGKLDIDEQISELLLLEFPIKLLCREDCPGLCSQCGKLLVEGICGCSEKEVDPRLKILEQLISDDK